MNWKFIKAGDPGGAWARSPSQPGQAAAHFIDEVKRQVKPSVSEHQYKELESAQVFSKLQTLMSSICDFAAKTPSTKKMEIDPWGKVHKMFGTAYPTVVDEIIFAAKIGSCEISPAKIHSDISEMAASASFKGGIDLDQFIVELKALYLKVPVTSGRYTAAQLIDELDDQRKLLHEIVGDKPGLKQPEETHYKDTGVTRHRLTRMPDESPSVRAMGAELAQWEMMWHAIIDRLETSGFMEQEFHIRAATSAILDAYDEKFSDPLQVVYYTPGRTTIADFAWMAGITDMPALLAHLNAASAAEPIADSKVQELVSSLGITLHTVDAEVNEPEIIHDSRGAVGYASYQDRIMSAKHMDFERSMNKRTKAHSALWNSIGQMPEKDRFARYINLLSMMTDMDVLEQMSAVSQPQLKKFLETLARTVSKPEKMQVSFRHVNELIVSTFKTLFDTGSEPFNWPQYASDFISKNAAEMAFYMAKATHRDKSGKNVTVDQLVGLEKEIALQPVTPEQRALKKAFDDALAAAVPVNEKQTLLKQNYDSIKMDSAIPVATVNDAKAAYYAALMEAPPAEVSAAKQKLDETTQATLPSEDTLERLRRIACANVDTALKFAKFKDKQYHEMTFKAVSHRFYATQHYVEVVPGVPDFIKRFYQDAEHVSDEDYAQVYALIGDVPVPRPYFDVFNPATAYIPEAPADDGRQKWQAWQAAAQSMASTQTLDRTAIGVGVGAEELKKAFLEEYAKVFSEKKWGPPKFKDQDPSQIFTFQIPGISYNKVWQLVDSIRGSSPAAAPAPTSPGTPPAAPKAKQPKKKKVLPPAPAPVLPPPAAAAPAAPVSPASPAAPVAQATGKTKADLVAEMTSALYGHIEKIEKSGVLSAPEIDLLKKSVNTLLVDLTSGVTKEEMAAPVPPEMLKEWPAFLAEGIAGLDEETEKLAKGKPAAPAAQPEPAAAEAPAIDPNAQSTWLTYGAIAAIVYNSVIGKVKKYLESKKLAEDDAAYTAAMGQAEAGMKEYSDIIIGSSDLTGAAPADWKAKAYETARSVFADTKKLIDNGPTKSEPVSGEENF